MRKVGCHARDHEAGSQLNATNAAWIAQWIDSVACGSATMSQRAMTSIDAHGGIEAVVSVARARGVHLVQLTGDNGRLLVAASKEPFTSLC